MAKRTCTNWSCFPGRSSSARSQPSFVVWSDPPTATIATSAAAAAAVASAKLTVALPISDHCSSTFPFPSGFRYSIRMGTATPFTRSRVVSNCPCLIWSGLHALMDHSGSAASAPAPYASLAPVNALPP